MKKDIKLCLVCSVGGHLTEIMQLEYLYMKYKHFFITEYTELTKDLSGIEKVYFVRLINRKKWDFVVLFLLNTFTTLFYLIKENPDIIISTGALSSIPCCILGKIMRKRIIFLETFAKIYTPTMTGRLIYRFADLFIVQWKPLLKYYPNAVYGGSIF